MTDNNKINVANELAQLRSSYIADLDERIAEIRRLAIALTTSFSSAEYETLKNLLHKFKGSGSTFGFPEISSVSAEFESWIKNYDKIILPKNAFTYIEKLSKAAAVARTIPENLKEVEKTIETAAQPHANEILIIANEYDENTKKLSSFLNSQGYKTKVFNYASSAIKHSENRQYAAILFDLEFKDVKLINADELGSLRSRYPETPLIVTSSENSLHHRSKVLSYGIDYFFTRPLDYQSICVAIDSLTSRHISDPIRVMIVDDDRALAKYYALVLQGELLDCHTAFSPEKAYRDLESFKPDVLLLDQNLQTLDGIQFAQIIRQMINFANLPIVFLSAETSQKTVAQAHLVGADDYLTKPVTPARLKKAVMIRGKWGRRQAELNKALNAAIDEMTNARNHSDQASKHKSDFLANMSHEIRTPLNGIIGMAQLLLDDELPAHHREQIEMLSTSGDILLAVVNDILDFSKIEAGKLELESLPINFTTIANELTAMFNPRAKEKGISIRFEVQTPESFAAIGDPIRLRQILLNLIGNAIKFTNEGDVTIQFTLLSQDQNDCQIRFSVTDTGIGMSGREIEKLFTAFAQADSSTTRKFGGTGLGLAICERLVGIMGGKINVLSVEGEGSQFFFDLSMKVASPEDLEAASSYKSSSYDSLAIEGVPIAGKILVAEDNPINQKLVEKYLEKLGYEFHIVDNGAEALEAVKSGNYSCVLMDCQMPIMDGYTATAEIRRDKNLSEIPIIAVTAHALESERQKCIDLGMNDYLSKPLKLTLLREMLYRYIGTPLSSHTENTIVGAEVEIAAEETPDYGNLVSAHPLIDSTHLESIAELDDTGEFLAEMIGAFVEKTPIIFENLLKAIKQQDQNESIHLAHYLKGSAGNVGALRLNKLMGEIEQAGRNGDLKVADRLTKTAIDLFKESTELLLSDWVLKKAS